MSSSPPPRQPRQKKKPGAKGDGSERRSPDSGYEVGYGKPPKATRFAKGQSGNPRGRPRKPKPRPTLLSDAPSDGYLEAEAYRPIELLEKGERIELPTLQAVQRAVAVGALKGNRLSQKYFLEYVAKQEERHLQLKVNRYVRLETLKREGEKLIAEHARKGLPAPDLLPHPEDIVLDPSTGEAYVNGPETREDVRVCEHTARMRDHALLRSFHAHKLRGRNRPRTKEGTVCWFLLSAQFFNRSLPPRYRLDERAVFSVMTHSSDLSMRERERRIDAEFVELEATKPPSRLPPEVRDQIDRLVGRLTRGKGDPADAAD